MIPKFRNLLEAQQFFKDENTCWKYWEKVRWNGQPVCPHCGTVSKPYKLQGRRYKCSDKDCYKKFSALVGTIFEDTKLPLQKWFLAAYLITAHKKGISSHQLARDLGITQKSAWFVLHRLREMLRYKAPQVLEGTVQIDSTFIGGKLKFKSNKKRKAVRESNAGKNDEKSVVLALIEGGKVVNHVVEGEKAHQILPIMRGKVKEGSTIVTDEARMYRLLRDKYTHVTVNHNKSQYVTNGFTTNSVEGYFSLLKRGLIGIYHNVSAKHLHRYCDEFAYRYNTRTVKDNERFNQCFEQAEGKHLPYKRLINKK